MADTVAGLQQDYLPPSLTALLDQ